MSDNVVSYFLNASKRTRAIVVIVFVVIVVPFFVWLWWDKVYEGPSGVFWGMIDNNLSTTALTKKVSLKSSGADLSQLVDFHLGKDNYAHALSVFSQTGSSVETEEINASSSDFVRYLQVVSSQKDSSGRPFNFSKLIGLWGEDNQLSNTSSQLFNQTQLGIFPIANLNPDNRSTILQLIHSSNVYQVDFSKVHYSNDQGRHIIIYPVQVDQSAYVSLINKVASLAGLNTMGALNPSDFKNTPKLNVLISIDKLNHNLRTVAYPGGQHKETFTSFNVVSTQNFATPTKTVPFAQLKQALLNVANQSH